MHRSTLKDNVFPFILMLIGGLIILALSLYLFQADYPLLGALLLGLLTIAIGVAGIILTAPKSQEATPSAEDAGPQDAPSTRGAGSPGVPRADAIAPETAPPVSPFATVYVSPTKQYTLTFSKPVLIAGMTIFICTVLLLVFGLGMALRSLLITRDTQIVDCREAAAAVAKGWQVVLTYTYHTEEAASAPAVYSACVLERERYVWEKEKRPTKEGTPTATAEPAARGGPTWTPAPNAYTPLPTPTIGTSKAPLPTATPFSPPAATATQMSWPTTTPFSPPAATATQMPWPTATPLSPPAAGATQTPRPEPPSSSPAGEIDVCTAIANDAYLNAVVKWSGTILAEPADEDEGLLLKVLWTNPNSGAGCSEATFFVLYTGAERFFEEDRIVVKGTITNTRYEYETESGEIALTVLMRSEAVELLNEP